MDNTKKDPEDKNQPVTQTISKTCQTGFTSTQILTHNIPLLCMYIVGTIIVGFLCIYCAIAFIIYIIISNIVFMVTICAYCPHYGTRSSLCGYGLLTKNFTTRKRPREFKRQFKKYIAVLFPIWFVPLLIGIYLLIFSFDWIVLIILIFYIILAFGVVLYVSRSKSCKTCKHRDQCPWNSICG